MWEKRQRVRWDKDGDAVSRIYGSTAELAYAWVTDEADYNEVMDTDESGGRTGTVPVCEVYRGRGAFQPRGAPGQAGTCTVHTVVASTRCIRLCL